MNRFIKKNWFLVVTMLYVLSPIDFLPDQIPLIGQTDDAFVVLIEFIRRYQEYKTNLEKKENGQA